MGKHLPKRRLCRQITVADRMVLPDLRDGCAGAYPSAIYVASSDRCSEMCIGAGAHTHYWDDTAPDIAEQLNALIGGSEGDVDTDRSDLHPTTPELSQA